MLPQGDNQLLAAPDLSGQITWTSSDESVAVVDENGMVTMVGDGEATITASDENGEEETFHLSTEPPVSSGVTSAPGMDDPEDATFLWWVLGRHRRSAGDCCRGCGSYCTEEKTVKKCGCPRSGSRFLFWNL